MLHYWKIYTKGLISAQVCSLGLKARLSLIAESVTDISRHDLTRLKTPFALGNKCYPIYQLNPQDLFSYADFVLDFYGFVTDSPTRGSHGSRE